MKHIYPQNNHERRETLFDNLDAFNNSYREEQKKFEKMAVFYFDSICVTEKTYKQTETTKWFGKQVPISGPISSYLIPYASFSATLILIISSRCLILLSKS